MRFGRPLWIAAAAALIVVTPLLAAAYSAPYTITETSSNAYAMLPVSVSEDIQWLADNGFMEADALDTRIETLGGLARPHMVVDDRILTAVAVPADSQTNLYFTTGSSDLTAMDIIVGYNGYLTVTDTAGLELGNNFGVEFDGYVDTSAGSDKNLIDKLIAFRIYISAATDITADIFAAPATDQSHSTGAVAANMYGVLWEAQTFQPAVTGYLTSVTLRLNRTGSPAGDLDVVIRATSGDLPIAGDLAAASVLASTIPTGATEVQLTFTAPVWLTSGTRYAIVTSVPGGTAGNSILWWRNAADTYANGRQADSADSGSSWAGVVADFRFLTTMAVASATVTATGVTNGEHIVEVTADTTDLKIFIDTIEEDTVALAGASVTDNSNDWTINQNNVLPYMDYYEHTVGGSLITRYEPNTMIIGTNLPDREAASNDATITFGANPAGVTVTLGGMVSEDQPAPGIGVDDPTIDVLPAVGVSDWFGEPDVSGTLLTNPLRPFVTLMSDTTTITELQAWRLLALAGILGVTVLAIGAVRGHLLIAGTASAASIGLAVALTIFPFWTLVFAIGAIAGGLVSERSPSL